MTRTSEQARPAPAGPEEFQHEALLYAGIDEFLGATVPFVAEGVAAGEPVLVAVPEPRLSALRDAVGDVGRHVAFADMARIGANPAHIIPVWRDFLDRHGRGTRPVRGIGEPIWAARGPDELVECQRHEALLNVAFADSGGWRLLCPYDTTALDPAVVDEARRSHPILSHAGTRQANDRCRDLDAMGRPFDAPLPPPPATAGRVEFVAITLPSVRRFVVRLAAGAGLLPPRLDDLTLSVHEMAANSVRHGGGSGVVRGWADDERVVFEVADRGHVVDPLAGRTKPDLDGVHGRGLWMAHQLCDLVQLRTFAEGTVVRLHMRVNR
jgi:anti-sigma regulatory factor (Ser/Thr protein kinase)